MSYRGRRHSHIGLGIALASYHNRKGCSHRSHIHRSHIHHIHTRHIITSIRIAIPVAIAVRVKLLEWYLVVEVTTIDICLTAVVGRHTQHIRAFASKPWVYELDAIALVISSICLSFLSAKDLSITAWQNPLYEDGLKRLRIEKLLNLSPAIKIKPDWLQPIDSSTWSLLLGTRFKAMSTVPLSSLGMISGAIFSWSKWPILLICSPLLCGWYTRLKSIPGLVYISRRATSSYTWSLPEMITLFILALVFPRVYVYQGSQNPLFTSVSIGKHIDE